MRKDACERDKKRRAPGKRLAQHQPHQNDHGSGQKRGEYQGMGEMAVIVKVVEAATGESGDVQVGCIRGKYKEQGRIRRKTVQTGMTHKKAGQAVGDVLQCLD